MPLKLATWNVNSIRARLERADDWLKTREPDVVCLQETKVTDDKFPVELFTDLGYEVAIYGQKTYNGVAIASRKGLADVTRGFGDGDTEGDARLISATVGDVRVLCAYFPNGKSPDSDKYPVKLDWMARLRKHLDAKYRADQPLILCGDFNVAPEDRDVHDPAAWKDDILCTDQERQALADIRAFGLVDLFRVHNDEPGLYSWWDYRMLGFPKNRGLRIDHIYGTEPMVARTSEPHIDREARKGKGPSDHAPVFITVDG